MLARAFADHAVAVTVANTRGPEPARKPGADLDPTVIPGSIADDLEAEVILAAVPFLTNCPNRTRPQHPH